MSGLPEPKSASVGRVCSYQRNDSPMDRHEGKQEIFALYNQPTHTTKED